MVKKMVELDDKSNKANAPLDEDKRRFLVAAASVLGGVGAACALSPFIASWLPSAKSQAAAAPLQVDLRHMALGEQMIVEWRGKPIWIIRRTQDMLHQLSENQTLLRDPKSLVNQQPLYAKNNHRSINPEYLVLIGICTHLGCSPKYKLKLGDVGAHGAGGFFCPCHGSTFDLAGRVFKGVPAPVNMEVPPYHFINNHTIVIGEEP